ARPRPAPTSPGAPPPRRTPSPPRSSPSPRRPARPSTGRLYARAGALEPVDLLAGQPEPLLGRVVGDRAAVRENEAAPAVGLRERVPHLGQDLGAGAVRDRSALAQPAHEARLGRLPPDLAHRNAGQSVAPA